MIRDLPGEVWKNTTILSDSYKVSNKARVKSIDRIIVDSVGRKRLYPGRLIKGARNNEHTVNVSYSLSHNNNKATSRTISWLMYTAFIGDLPDGYVTGFKAGCEPSLENITLFKKGDISICKDYNINNNYNIKNQLIKAEQPVSDYNIGDHVDTSIFYNLKHINKQLYERNLKICKLCETVKNVEDFGYSRKGSNGKNIYCLECCRKKSKHYRANNQKSNKDTSHKIKLEDCIGSDKMTINEADELYKLYLKDEEMYRNQGNFKKANECRGIANKIKLEYTPIIYKEGDIIKKQNVTIKEIATINKALLLKGLKRCGHCERVLPIDNFGVNNSMVDKLQGNCKTCRASQLRELRQTERTRKPKKNKVLLPSRLGLYISDDILDASIYNSIKGLNKALSIKKKKVCNNCKIVKHVKDFDFIGNSKNRKAICRECNKADENNINKETRAVTAKIINTIDRQEQITVLQGWQCPICKDIISPYEKSHKCSK